MRKRVRSARPAFHLMITFLNPVSVVHISYVDMNNWVKKVTLWRVSPQRLHC